MVQHLDRRLDHVYDPKGYANEQQCLYGLENHIAVLNKAGFTRSFLGVENWGPHLEHPFRVAPKDANDKVVFLPGGTTELTAFTN